MHTAYQKNLGLAGLATMNGSRKSGRNAMLRSPRQRRKAFERQQDELIKAAWKRWGEVENMPIEEQAKLHSEITRLEEIFLGY